MLNNKENNQVEKIFKHRFVIGIGSQRAGSTLLHRLLSASTNIFMHPLKELHYFDTLYKYRSFTVLKDFSQRQINREINKIVEAKNFDFIDKEYRCYLRTNNILSNKNLENIDYLDLFRPCLASSELLGEVTPEYMLLDDVAIKKMKNVVGEDAAIILICRNPVNRILSAVKLMNSYNNMKMDDTTAGLWLMRMIDENNSWMIAQDRYNNYQAAIESYSRHFPHFVAISYDQMIMDPIKTAKKLEDVINIKINTEVFKHETGKVVNGLGSDFKIDSLYVEQLSSRYKKDKEFIETYFNIELTK